MLRFPCIEHAFLGEYVSPHWSLLDILRWVTPRAGGLGIEGKARHDGRCSAVVGEVLDHLSVSYLASLALPPLALELTNY